MADGVTVNSHRLNGFDLVTFEMGAGPPLLYLHGFEGTAPLLANGGAAPFLQRLAEAFRVVVPQHPGFGAQEAPGWLDDMHDLAYFYLDWLGAGKDRVHVVGSSIGGWLAAEMAVRDCSRIASLTLASPAGIHVAGVPKGDIFLWPPEKLAERCIRSADARRHFMDALDAKDREMEVARARETVALLSWQPRLYDPHLHKWLHRISSPVRLIWPADDAVLPPAYARRWSELVAQADVVSLENCGHLAHLDRPDAFADAVTAFIRSQSS